MASSSRYGCPSLIDFTPTEKPSWRDRLAKDKQPNKTIPSMLNDIVEYRKKWNELKRRGFIKAELEMKGFYRMLCSFIHHVNVEEEIGTQEEERTKEIVYAEIRKEGNSRQTRRLRRSLSKNETETRNIFKAYRHLEDIIADSDTESKGLLEMELCIMETHKILMTGVIVDKGQTGPGVFSTRLRSTEYKGKTHHYPVRKTTNEWENAIMTHVDRYNSLIKDIQNEKEDDKRVLKTFNCAAWLLFTLVSEHPFSDGNGRLCRLLASYVLQTLTPFPSPIYNIYGPTDKNDYVDAIVKAREGSNHPEDLTALMIESNWYAWRQFFTFLEIDIQNV